MECGTEMASAGSWQEAVSRSAEAAAHAVAAAAAFSFRQKLLELASVQAGRQGSLGNSPRAVQTHNDPSTKPGHCLNSPHADAGRAVGRAPAEGATSGCCEVEDVQLGPKEVAGLGDKAVNENELQLGLELHAEVGFCTFACTRCATGRHTQETQKGKDQREHRQFNVHICGDAVFTKKLLCAGCQGTVHLCRQALCQKLE